MMLETDHTDLVPLTACTISRDVVQFDLLIEDMEAALGSAWGDLSFDEAAVFLDQPDAEQLRFVVIAIDAEDEAILSAIAQLIHKAKSRGLRVILVADGVTPVSLHQLLREGADEFIPYPLPEDELDAAIARVTAPPPEPAPAAPVEVVAHHVDEPIARQVSIAPAHDPNLKGDHAGVVIPVHALAGGVGATTLAVNLANELAQCDKADPPSVCLLDFAFQFGAVATYLDITRRDNVLDFLTRPENIDSESFLQVLQPYGDRLQVLTAPVDIVPLDLMSPADLDKVIAIARKHFDYVVIDLPNAMVDWTETVLNAAHVYFAVMERDLRSAENARRMKAMLTGEGMAFGKLRFVLNRAPGFTDFAGKTRVKSLAQKLDISIDVQLPDGGHQVAECSDAGKALSDGAAKNALRREIAKLAKSLHSVNVAEPEAKSKDKAKGAKAKVKG